jgi:GNAT superfamily N-acetyltransferase
VLLQGAFPPSELVTLDELRGALREFETAGLILLADQDPVAGIVTEEYLEGRVLLVAYLVVAPKMRSRGIGAKLVERVVEQNDASELVFAEIEDPRYFKPTGAVDPLRRLRFYDRIGSRLIPIPYVQPSLRPSSERVSNLLLVVVCSDREFVDGALLTRFLDEYYTACEGDDFTGDDAAYLSLRKAALGDQGGILPLVSLTALDAARPGPTGAM